jgi:flagellar basal body-associated protein FliL
MMEKKAIMVIAICAAIGFAAGGFAGYGITFAANPETPVTPTHVLTIIEYKSSTYSANVTWTPANAGINYTNVQDIITITFAENTNVTLTAVGAAHFDQFQGPDGADAHYIDNIHYWIVMDSDKIITTMWS